MSRPENAPPLPNGLPITPRVCSIETAEKLGFLTASLFDDDALVEVVAFGYAQDEDDGELWVAVRFTCDLPRGLGSVSKADWIKQDQLEDLMPMRLLLSKTPDDIGAIEDGLQLGRSILNAGRRTTSHKRRKTSPSDGIQLTEDWRRGRRPIIRTKDWLTNAFQLVDQSVQSTISEVLHLLATRSLRVQERRHIIAVLELVAPLVSDLKAWPPNDEDGPSLDQIIDSFSEEIDLEVFDEDPDMDD